MGKRQRVAETAFKVLSAVSVLTAVFDGWRAFNPPGHADSPWLGMMAILAVFAVGHLGMAAVAFGAAAYARTAESRPRRTAILLIAGLLCGTFQLLGILVATLASF